VTVSPLKERFNVLIADDPEYEIVKKTAEGKDLSDA